MESCIPIGSHGSPVVRVDISAGGDSGKIRVTRILRERILAGRFQFGETLPSERRLSEELGVGRTVVRNALAELDKEGMLARRGPHQRTVAFNRGDGIPAWLRQAIIVLTMPRVTEGSASVRQRWLKYTTLGTMENLREAGIPALTLGVGAVDDGQLQSLARGRPLGVLIPEIHAQPSEVIALARVFSDCGAPVVCYGGSPSLAGLDRVASNHEAGSFALTQAVIERGAQRIVQCWPQPWEQYWFASRDAGYRRAMLGAGLSPLPIREFPYIGAPNLEQKTFDYAVKVVAGFFLDLFRDARPDAILLSTDRDISYAAAALRLHGLEPGKDILIAGYDNYWDRCEERAFEAFVPDLTVDKCNESVGGAMVQMVLDRVAGRLAEGPQMHICDQNVLAPSLPSLAGALSANDSL